VAKKTGGGRPVEVALSGRAPAQAQNGAVRDSRFRGSDGAASRRGTRQGSSLPLVVGVGASAGGLEAFTELLSQLPEIPAWHSC